jgi:hypothetical protein
MVKLIQPEVQDFFNGLCCTDEITKTCYSKTTTTQGTPQSPANNTPVVPDGNDVAGIWLVNGTASTTGTPTGTGTFVLPWYASGGTPMVITDDNGSGSRNIRLDNGDSVSADFNGLNGVVYMAGLGFRKVTGDGLGPAGVKMEIKLPNGNIVLIDDGTSTRQGGGAGWDRLGEYISGGLGTFTATQTGVYTLIVTGITTAPTRFGFGDVKVKNASGEVLPSISTTTKYTKTTTNGVDVYTDESGATITGAALTQLLADISSGAAVVVSCAPIVQTPPTIEYTDTTLTFTEGVAVNICPATLTGSPTIVVTVSPSLPPNLVLNPSTGCITGIPSGTSSPTNYTFTATNSAGTDTDNFTIEISAPVIPVPPTIEYTDTTLTFTQGTAVNICPATLTGDPTIVVTVSPSLPAGLSLDPATGCITGTPTGSSVATNYTFTATNSVGTDTDSINVTVDAVTPPATLWIVETTTTTKDLKALYPTATAFEFKIVGAGGSGRGGAARHINTQSNTNSGTASGGGYTNITIPASSFTAPATLEVGMGSAGSAGAINGASSVTAGPGITGGTSAVKIGATTLADAKGGNGATGNWAVGGVGLTLNGGQANNITGITGFYGTNSASKGIGFSPPPMSTSTSTGSGGACASFTTSTAIRFSQAGQNASTGAIGGVAGNPNTNDYILGKGGDGQDGSALTDGTLLFGAGGGGGGLGFNNSTKGSNGGDGGFPGGAGGNGGSGTTAPGGNAGRGANGVIMWRPIF